MVIYLFVELFVHLSMCLLLELFVCWSTDLFVCMLVELCDAVLGPSREDRHAKVCHVD